MSSNWRFNSVKVCCNPGILTNWLSASAFSRRRLANWLCRLAASFSSSNLRVVKNPRVEPCEDIFVPEGSVEGWIGALADVSADGSDVSAGALADALADG